MRFFLIFLFALSMSVSALAAYRMPEHCCPEAACATLCPAMQCGTASPAIAPPPAAMAFSTVELAAGAARERPVVMPSTVEEIWIPPD
ncbi:hypothetical protein [Massilia sp. METH4]|uniref:hypothetical protein n=1 Tax=Massilia sp. METH4 TaxID=3123041 RepID=UPI0030D475EA